MKKNKYIYICIVFSLLFARCIVDGQAPVCYDRAEPVTFNLTVCNRSNASKNVLFVRTNADNEEFKILENSSENLSNIICIDKRWRGKFGYGQFGGMRGESDIKLEVGNQYVDIGKYNIFVNDLNPTFYGEFVSGELVGVKTGIVELKLTINEDGTLKLEYPNISISFKRTDTLAFNYHNRLRF